MLCEGILEAVQEYLKEKTGIRTHNIVSLDCPYDRRGEYIVKVVVDTVTDVVALYNANISHEEALGKRGLLQVIITLYIPENEIRHVQ